MFNGIMEGLNLFIKYQIKTLYNMQCKIYNGGFIAASKVICNLFTENGKSVHNQVISLKAYCESRNINPYILKGLKRFPETRMFHILHQIGIIIISLPIIKDWYHLHQV